MFIWQKPCSPLKCFEKIIYFLAEKQRHFQDVLIINSLPYSQFHSGRKTPDGWKMVAVLQQAGKLDLSWRFRQHLFPWPQIANSSIKETPISLSNNLFEADSSPRSIHNGWGGTENLKRFQNDERKEKKANQYTNIQEGLGLSNVFL